MRAGVWGVRGRGNVLHVEFLGGLPGRERGLFKAFVDPEIVV